MYSQVFSFQETCDKYHTLKNTSVKGMPLEALIQTPYALFGDLDNDQLEMLAQRAQAITRQRFGHVMRFFIPLYLSNECFNHCTYCGFSYERKIDRYTLSEAEVDMNIDILVKRGFQHVLLLTGEASKTVEMTYFKRILPRIRSRVAQLGMEVQPLSTADYRTLIDLGLDAVTVYQETYHKDRYLMHHLSGKKRRFDYRLDAADRACEAGIFRLNMGALLGLSDWQYEAIALVDHLQYLSKHYWKTHWAISFPRITSIFDATRDLKPVSDRVLVQLVCAFRCLFPDIGITLSTREKAVLRDGLITLGITDMSAESQTSPGAYSGVNAEPQFATSDHRSLNDICKTIKKKGLDPILKDWDRTYTCSIPISPD
ncbi:MAG: 2-iminoacetate synthase ThiH [Candidatus Marinamargulisbacteria bacterium]